YFFAQRPPAPSPASRAVAPIKQDISGPYEKIRIGMSMEECYQLLGIFDSLQQIGTAGGARWDNGAIRIDFSPGGIARPSGQKVTRVRVRRDYNRFRWFCYSIKKRYLEFTNRCDALQRSTQ